MSGHNNSNNNNEYNNSRNGNLGESNNETKSLHDDSDSNFDAKSVKSHTSGVSRSRGRGRRGSVDSRFNEENLGDEFEDTPWLPPSIAKAILFKESAIIRQGCAPLRTVQVCKAADLGQGVSLYFQFVKSMGIAMLFSSILSLPALIFAYYGSRIPTQDQDAIGFYQFTLGNIGYNTASATYTQDSACTEKRNINATSTCVHLFDNKVELTLVTVGSILTLCEVIQYFVFMSAVFFLLIRMKSLSKLMEKEDQSISDYAVMVKNLPQDCSFEQILSHFSNLYGLDKPDWLQRPPLEGAHTVTHCEHSMRPTHIGTWVSELTVFKKIGLYIGAFKAQENLTTKLFRARAKMKMYADDTPFFKGYNNKKYRQAEKEMNKIQLKIDRLSQKVIKTRDLAFHTDNTKFGKSSHDLEAGYRDYNTQIDADVVAAFVTFEYSESMARCIEDYTRYSTFPRNLFYPSELKFRGSRITVKRAPEPDDIVWENLEVSTFHKRIKRLTSTVAMIVALICSFLIILLAGQYKQKFESSIPNLEYCPSTLPQQYAISGINNYTIQGVSNYIQTRPPNDEMSTYDNDCQTILANTFYVIYTENGDFNKPIVDYSYDACKNDKIGLCPVYPKTSFCPCVSVTSSQSCSTYACDTSGSDSILCHNYDAKLIGDCFCFAEVQSLINRGFGISFMQAYNKLSNTGECKSFYINYTLQSAMTYLATFLVVIINKILEVFLYYLNRDEKHSSVSNEMGSYMLKIFFAQYINMALVVLVAFGRINNTPSTLKQTGIFQGTYTDFNSAWYGAVGSYLMLTFIIQVASIPVYPLLQYFIIYPFCRWYSYPSIRNAANSRIVMQEDLNSYEVGPVFETSYSTACVLAIIFFAMTYATGIPLLMPCVCLTLFLFFNIDKLLICRFNHRPPRISEGVIRTVIYFLPYAELIRLGFGIWMYGNPAFIPADVVSTTFDTGSFVISSDAYAAWLQSLSKDILPPRYSWFYNHILRPNVFPLFVLFCFTIFVMIMNLLITYLLPFDLIINYFYQKCLKCCGRGKISIYSTDSGDNSKSRRNSRNSMSRKSIILENGEEIEAVNGYELIKLNDDLRQESAPFSEQYYSYVMDKDEIPNTCKTMCCHNNRLFLSEQEIIDGWVHVDHEKYVLKCKIWVDARVLANANYQRNIDDKSRKSGKSDNNNDANKFTVAKKQLGDFKRTYEVIADEGCASYNLEMIPAYKKAIIGLEQGAQNMEVDAEIATIEKYKLRKQSMNNSSAHGSSRKSKRNLSRQNSKSKSKMKLLTDEEKLELGEAQDMKENMNNNSGAFNNPTGKSKNDDDDDDDEESDDDEEDDDDDDDDEDSEDDDDDDDEDDESEEEEEESDDDDDDDVDNNTRKPIQKKPQPIVHNSSNSKKTYTTSNHTIVPVTAPANTSEKPQSQHMPPVRLPSMRPPVRFVDQNT